MRGNNYFSDFELDEPENDMIRFNVRGGRGNGNPFDNSYRREGPNWYGRSDGSGRYYGDNHDSNSQPCLGGESNAAQLNTLNGGGYSYPCQRFR